MGGHYLEGADLGDAYGPRAHAHPEGIHAHVNQVLGLLGGDHVPPYDLQVGVL